MSAPDFTPPRQRGLIVHGIFFTLLLVVSGISFAYASREDVGPLFTLFLLIAIGAFVPLPILAYHLYALQRAYYRLDRDMLTISWGLRLEELPLNEIEWVRTASDLVAPLDFPRLRLPGAILGTRRHPDLGLVEFLASEPHGLLLVATARRTFAISPADPSGFMHDFQRSVELGSLEHARGRSVYPSFVVARAWESVPARFLWLGGALLNLGMLIWVSILIPTHASTRLGFNPAGIPLDPVPSASLMLLPLISITFLVVNWLVGLYYYRRPEQSILAFLLWASGMLTALLFLVAVGLSISSLE